jgi:hypothetical protein
MAAHPFVRSAWWASTSPVSQGSSAHTSDARSPERKRALQSDLLLAECPQGATADGGREPANAVRGVFILI